tara:strand:+ start:407 stop:655 length:249 start_codon:yes stop_codon:yes gene_type:complete
MVWIKVFFFIFFIFTKNTHSNELSNDELMYFNFFDLNNDEFISVNEINETTNILFQLIDINKDNKISKDELLELKKIFDFLK